MIRLLLSVVAAGALVGVTTAAVVFPLLRHVLAFAAVVCLLYVCPIGGGR